MLDDGFADASRNPDVREARLLCLASPESSVWRFMHKVKVNGHVRFLQENRAVFNLRLPPRFDFLRDVLQMTKLRLAVDCHAVVNVRVRLESVCLRNLSNRRCTRWRIDPARFPALGCRRELSLCRLPCSAGIRLQRRCVTPLGCVSDWPCLFHRRIQSPARTWHVARFLKSASDISASSWLKGFDRTPCSYGRRDPACIRSPRKRLSAVDC